MKANSKHCPGGGRARAQGRSHASASHVGLSGRRLGGGHAEFADERGHEQ